MMAVIWISCLELIVLFRMNNEIQKFRSLQDQLNQQIAVDLLTRLELSLRILKEKESLDLPAMDLKREDDILSSIIRPEMDFIQQLYLEDTFRFLFEKSRDAFEAIRTAKSSTGCCGCGCSRPQV